MSYHMFYFDNLPNHVIVFLCLNISIVALAKKLKEKKIGLCDNLFFLRSKYKIMNFHISIFQLNVCKIPCSN